MQGVEYERGEGGAVEVRWARGLGRGSDTVHVYAYCPAASTGLAVAAAERSRKGVRFLLPEGFAMEEVHLWVFAEGKEGAVSATTYAEPSASSESIDTECVADGGQAGPLAVGFGRVGGVGAEGGGVAEFADVARGDG